MNIKKIFLFIFFILLLSAVAIGIFFIVIAAKPITIQVVNNNPDESFTWGDTIDLQAHVSKGLKSIIKYKWELIPIVNSTILLNNIIIKDVGENLKITVDDEKYFEVATFKVYASYSGSLFTKTAEISLLSYKTSNQTQFINSTNVQTFNSTSGTLVVNGSSNLKVGDIVIEENGLFIVSISNITSIKDQVYTYQVQNSTVSNAFSFLNLAGELQLDDGSNSGSSSSSTIPSSLNKLQQQKRTLLEEEASSSSERNFDIKFTPLKNGGLNFILNNNPNSSFHLSSESSMSISCSNPMMTSVVTQNNFGSQSYKIVCEYDINFSGTIDIPKNIEGEYTYWLYGGDNQDLLLNDIQQEFQNPSLNRTLPESLTSETNGIGGLIAKGKIFKLAWKGLKYGAKKLFTQILEIKVPLRIKYKTQTDGSLISFRFALKNQVSFEYEYTSTGGFQLVPTTPINWELNDGTFASGMSLNSCNSEIDLSVGIGLYRNFLGVAEAGAEFLIHAPIWNSYTNQYAGKTHGIDIPGQCVAGYRPETTVVGFTVGVEIGLQIWKFGISKPFELLDFGFTLLHWTCSRAPCTLNYIRYSCSSGGGIFSKPECYEDSNGKYSGLQECKAHCGGCSACPNPNCCNCPGNILYPCPGSCAFACPGEVGACCFS